MIFSLDDKCSSIWQPCVLLKINPAKQLTCVSVLFPPSSNTLISTYFKVSPDTIKRSYRSIALLILHSAPASLQTDSQHNKITFLHHSTGYYFLIFNEFQHVRSIQPGCRGSILRPNRDCSFFMVKYESSSQSNF